MYSVDIPLVSIGKRTLIKVLYQPAFLETVQEKDV